MTLPPSYSAGSSVAAPMFENVLSLSNRELFWIARHVQPSGVLEHLPFLFWLVANQTPRVIVSLAMGHGVGHMGLCQAVERLGLDTDCYGFGTWPQSDPLSSGVPTALVDQNEEFYDDFSRIGLVDASDAATRFRDGDVDLLCLEDTPSAQLLDDIRTQWLPRMSDQGIILLGGAEQLLQDPSRHAAFDALAKGHTTFEFTHGEGLLVIAVGHALPERVARLLQATRATPGYRAIHQMFRRLGAYYRKDLTARETREIAGHNRVDGPSAEAELVTLRNALGQSRAELAAAQAQLRDMAADRGGDAATPDSHAPYPDIAADPTPSQTDLDALMALTEQLEQQDAAIRHERESLMDAAAQAASGTAAQISDLDALTLLTEQLEQQDEVMRRERDDLTEALRAARQAAASAEAALETERSQHAATTKEREALKAKVRKLDRKLAETKQARDVAQAQADAMRSSTSWKVSSPVRRIGRLVGRGRD